MEYKNNVLVTCTVTITNTVLGTCTVTITNLYYVLYYIYKPINFCFRKQLRVKKKKTQKGITANNRLTTQYTKNYASEIF